MIQPNLALIELICVRNNQHHILCTFFPIAIYAEMIHRAKVTFISVIVVANLITFAQESHF